MLEACSSKVEVRMPNTDHREVELGGVTLNLMT